MTEDGRTKEQLAADAAELGVETKSSWNKAQLLEAVSAAEAARPLVQEATSLEQTDVPFGEAPVEQPVDAPAEESATSEGDDAQLADVPSSDDDLSYETSAGDDGVLTETWRDQTGEVVATRTTKDGEVQAVWRKSEEPEGEPEAVRDVWLEAAELGIVVHSDWTQVEVEDASAAVKGVPAMQPQPAESDDSEVEPEDTPVVQSPPRPKRRRPASPRG